MPLAAIGRVCTPHACVNATRHSGPDNGKYNRWRGLGLGCRCTGEERARSTNKKPQVRWRGLWTGFGATWQCTTGYEGTVLLCERNAHETLPMPKPPARGGFGWRCVCSGTVESHVEWGVISSDAWLIPVGALAYSSRRTPPASPRLCSSTNILSNTEAYGLRLARASRVHGMRRATTLLIGRHVTSHDTRAPQRYSIRAMIHIMIIMYAAVLRLLGTSISDSCSPQSESLLTEQGWLTVSCGAELVRKRRSSGWAHGETRVTYAMTSENTASGCCCLWHCNSV